MPTTVRVGDTVTYHIGGGEYVTAEITEVTTQDSITLEYFFHDEGALKTSQATTARATTWPPAADTFFKMA